MNLINPETRNVDAVNLDNKLYREIPYGVRNGIQNGLRLVLDVESFDHTYFSTAAKGFKIAISNALDKPAINQAGLYLEPGNLLQFFILKFFRLIFD